MVAVQSTRRSSQRKKNDTCTAVLVAVVDSIMLCGVRRHTVLVLPPLHVSTRTAVRVPGMSLHVSTAARVRLYSAGSECFPYRIRMAEPAARLEKYTRYTLYRTSGCFSDNRL